ncbi:MAG: hypothetical protein DMG08_01165 [Acidobacteria bacterium]|nr:MAG: hypothetical protein DMG08_01165 [Acidobacteriota bacterium]PYV02284.1 MAG: hypothetical protein DMG10_15135 [Acidobacteriota bacterium]PYV36728.1 MAG: hypothetical protein DMG09_16490 [Acidobacteriota bacterium]
MSLQPTPGETARSELQACSKLRLTRSALTAQVRRHSLTSMPRKTRVVRLSSKGQIIIPASLRRQLGLKKGQAMEVRRGDGRELIFAPVEEQNLDLEAMLAQARAWFAKAKDPVEELHRRRKKERELEVQRRERRSA